MIPIYLKLSGIYSYREPQEIDFRSLTALHLFGIFGPVGSGKSALLEAIMFALYGETERLNSRELRSYNMMNLKSNDAFIQFDFLAPGNKGFYRAIAKGKRNSRNKEDVKFERALYRMDEAGLVPVETSEIVSILGISYENFRRTIIIPQGKFQEFLQLGSRDRTEMVKEIFNLQRFDLSFKTSRLQKKNDELLNTCIGRLQQLGEILPEDIERHEKDLQLLLNELKISTELLSAKTAQENEYVKIQEISVSLDKNRVLLQDLESKRAEINQSEKRLNDYDECVANFKTDMGWMDERLKQLSADEINLKEQKEGMIKLTVLHNEAEKKFEAARKVYDTRENLLIQAQELETCAKVNSRFKEIEKLTERILNGEKQVSESSANLESLKAKKTQYIALQETLKTQLPDFVRLQKIQAWYAENNLLEEKKAAPLQLETSYNEELLLIENELIKLYSIAGLPKPGSTDDLDKLPELLNEQMIKAVESLNLINSNLIHLEVGEKMRSFVDQLHAGEPCPLCGSLEHPNILTSHNQQEEISSVKDEKNTREAFIKTLESANTKASLLLESSSKKQRERVNNRKNLSEAVTAIEKHKKTHVWPEITEESLRKEMEKFKRVQEELDKLDEQIKETSKQTEIESENYRKCNLLLGEIRIELARTQQDAESLLNQLKVSEYSAYASTTEEAILEQANNLREQYKIFGEQYLAAEKSVNEYRAKLQVLTGSINKMEETLLAQSNSMAELRKQLDVRILSSKFPNESSIREILSSKFDRQYEQKRIRAFQETEATLHSTIKLQEQQIHGRCYDGPTHELLKQEIADLKLLTDEKNQLKGAMESSLSKRKHDLEESIRLKMGLNTLESRRENLKTLTDLFRGQGFVNFISTIYLQNLVLAANNRFYRLTRQQLKLELDAENNFRIRDYLNDGEWRNVKTLSGGQTFQASLCLALALADNIQELNQNGQNFFFLDEGFGTLDKESLEQVFETLKLLRHENRIVGVISHVEDLQQEIGAWLRITRDEDQGSKVTTSWL